MRSVRTRQKHDAWVAATARLYGLSILTQDRDFEGFPQLHLLPERQKLDPGLWPLLVRTSGLRQDGSQGRRVAVALLAADSGLTAVVVACVLLGMTNGVATLARASVLGDLFGTAGYGTIGGVAAALSTTSRAVAPVAVGVSLAGSYALPLVVLAALSAIGRAADRHVTRAPVLVA